MSYSVVGGFSITKNNIFELELLKPLVYNCRLPMGTCVFKSMQIMQLKGLLCGSWCYVVTENGGIQKD